MKKTYVLLFMLLILINFNCKKVDNSEMINEESINVGVVSQNPMIPQIKGILGRPDINFFKIQPRTDISLPMPCSYMPFYLKVKIYNGYQCIVKRLDNRQMVLDSFFNVQNYQEIIFLWFDILIDPKYITFECSAKNSHGVTKAYYTVRIGRR